MFTGVGGRLVGRSDVKRPLERPRHRWEDTSNLDLEEVDLCGMDGIDLVRDGEKRGIFVKAVMIHQVPYIAGNFVTSCATISFSTGTVLPACGIGIGHGMKQLLSIL